jgi:hypothetical protein
MRTATTVARLLVRVCGLIQITLGLLFWTGNGRGLIPTHMLTGMVLVLAFLAVAIMAAVAGAPRGRVALAVAWAALTVALGMTQAQLLPGSFHWIVQVLHLVVGIAAIVQAEALAGEVMRRRPAAPARA